MPNTKTHLLITMATVLLSVMSVTSCQDDGRYSIRTGEPVEFEASIPGSELSKVTYAGAESGAVEEALNWEVGDAVRVYCAQASAPSCKYADYSVTSASGTKTYIEIMGAPGLEWAAGSVTHEFYAVSPSPASSGIATGIEANTVSATLPSVQGIEGAVTGTTPMVAAPDMKNMLMTAKTAVSKSSAVRLDFQPLTTAIAFTIKNDTGEAMTLKYVSLISGNGMSSAPAINGAFTVDLDIVSKPADVKPYDDSELTLKYSHVYPSCTGTEETTEMTERIALISFGGEDGTGSVTIGEGETLSFTFFLVPTHHFNDLTFKVGKPDGSWLSTRLGYDDGNGMFFPKYKKTTVTGVLVPEGARWKVRYAPDLMPWGEGDNGEMFIDYPGSIVRAIVTNWSKGEVDDIDLDYSGTGVPVIRWRSGLSDSTGLDEMGSVPVDGWSTGEGGETDLGHPGATEEGTVENWLGGESGDIIVKK